MTAVDIIKKNQIELDSGDFTNLLTSIEWNSSHE